MSTPVAYFLTWTCFATWLHGDERGSVDREHNAPRTPFLDADPGRRQIEMARVRNTPAELDTPARQIVRDTIIAHCRHRDWQLMALNVRTNHVHVVVSGPSDPNRALAEFKAWSTRRLREAGLIAATQRIWTSHGSTRYLWKTEQVAEKVHYVTDCQGPDLD